MDQLQVQLRKQRCLQTFQHTCDARHPPRVHYNVWSVYIMYSAVLSYQLHFQCVNTRRIRYHVSSPSWSRNFNRILYLYLYHYEICAVWLLFYFFFPASFFFIVLFHKDYSSVFIIHAVIPCCGEALCTKKIIPFVWFQNIFDLYKNYLNLIPLKQLYLKWEWVDLWQLLQLKTLMAWQEGNNAGLYLTNPTSPILSHCGVIILLKSVPVHQLSWLAL